MVRRSNLRGRIRCGPGNDTLRFPRGERSARLAHSCYRTAPQDWSWRASRLRGKDTGFVKTAVSPRGVSLESTRSLSDLGRIGCKMSWPVHPPRGPVSYTHLRAHETRHDLVCRLLLEKKKK